MPDISALSHLLLWLVALGLTGICLGLVRAVRGVSQETNAAADGLNLDLGANAPIAELSDLATGEITRLPVLGRRSILVFASPVCPDCRELVPVLNQFARHVAGAVDLTLVIEGDVDAAKRFAEDVQPEMRVLVDGDKYVADTYRARAVPFMVAVSPEGIVEAAMPLRSRDAGFWLTRIAPSDHAGQVLTSARAHGPQVEVTPTPLLR